jgi:hypothetical protein
MNICWHQKQVYQMFCCTLNKHPATCFSFTFENSFVPKGTLLFAPELAANLEAVLIFLHWLDQNLHSNRSQRRKEMKFII